MAITKYGVTTLNTYQISSPSSPSRSRRGISTSFNSTLREELPRMPTPAHSGPHFSPLASFGTMIQENCPIESAARAAVHSTYESARPPLVTNDLEPVTNNDEPRSVSRVSGI